MSKNSNSRSSAPRKGGSLLTGILVGMVLGLVVAAGLAWYILTKAPNSFVTNKETQREAAAKPPIELNKPTPAPAAKAAPTVAASAPAAASGVEAKPRFEFYKVLTDKQEGAVPPQKTADKPAATESKPAQPAAKETYYLQAGSFPSADDADKLKARLAMQGMEATVLAVTLPDKGVWHRVRLGPYKSADEMNKARAALKQNGVDATPMRAQ